MSDREAVIDADGHVTEPPGMWQQYVEPAIRERAPRFAMSEQGEPCQVADGRLIMRNALRLTLGSEAAKDGYVVRPGGFDPAEIRSIACPRRFRARTVDDRHAGELTRESAPGRRSRRDGG